MQFHSKVFCTKFDFVQISFFPFYANNRMFLSWWIAQVSVCDRLWASNELKTSIELEWAIHLLNFEPAGISCIELWAQWAKTHQALSLGHKVSIFFLSTGLPLARTKWVQSTFSSYCQLSSNQRHWFTSSIILPRKIFRKHWESHLGLSGEKQVCYLCAMQPPRSLNLNI